MSKETVTPCVFKFGGPLDGGVYPVLSTEKVLMLTYPNVKKAPSKASAKKAGSKGTLVHAYVRFDDGVFVYDGLRAYQGKTNAK